MEIQPQLVLLQKTLVNIEGLGRELYPQLDLWKTARPVLRRWMDEQTGGRAVVRALRQNLPHLRETLESLPAAIRGLSEQAADGRLQMDVRWPAQAELMALQRRQLRQRFWLATGMTAAVSGILVLVLATTTWPGWLLLAAGVASFVPARPPR
jgi:ubiquinone biosynthesis protein